MFFGAKQPFYQSSESMVLGKIDRTEYASFINSCFQFGNKKISERAIDYLLDFSETHTYYTQLICNQAFYKSDKTLDYEEAVTISQNYIETRKLDYTDILNLMAENQRKLIKAIAKEGVIGKPTSIEFLIKYKLPSASSSLQAVKVLTEKEMLFRTPNGYKVYDVFFRRFLEKYY
jgi:ribosomal protein S18